MQPVEEQLAVLTHGIDRIVPEEGLAELLEQDRPLRVKLGLDPTAPDVHLGWSVVLGLLRRFQELGHTAVLIVGDFTAQVGDPSEQGATRRRIDAAEVGEYAGTTLETMRELLLEANLEVRHNSEWLASMKMSDVLGLTSQMTVAQVLERDDFSKRYAAGEPISLIEFMYPLLQAMDSVAVEADIELGGADQLWNLLAGRQLQKGHGQEPQIAMTVPLLVGTDGERIMSQSLGNYISVKEEPAEMFGKVMSIPDEAMPQYFALVVGLPADELAALESELRSGDLDAGQVKRRLAREIVARFHDQDAASAAEAAFDRVFRDQGVPDDVPERQLPKDDPIYLPGLLRDAGVVQSSTDGRRMIEQNAVSIDGVVVSSERLPRDLIAGKVVRVGKRRFIRFIDG